MMAADDDFRKALLDNLKEAQIEIDQGRKPVRSIEELYQEITAIAKDNNIGPALVEEIFREFEDWRSKPLRKWKVVLKDIGYKEVGIVKARSKEEVLAGIECVGMECAPIENVEVTEIETSD